MDRYYNAKRLDPIFSEGEIASRIFMVWFLFPERKFSEDQKNKVQRYLDANFYPNNLLELCLISLDIEHNINPASDKNFNSLANSVKEMMINYDYKKESTEQDDPYKPDSVGTENAGVSLTHFTGRWYVSFL